MTHAEAALIADLVADRLRDRPPAAYLTTAGVAGLIGVSKDWVRDHAGELGASRVGDPLTGPLRFDVAEVRAAMDRRRVTPAVTTTPARAPARDFDLLPIPEGY